MQVQVLALLPSSAVGGALPKGREGECSRACRRLSPSYLALIVMVTVNGFNNTPPVLLNN